MRPKISTLVIACLCLFGLSGCINLKPVPSETESYALGPVGMVPELLGTEADMAVYIMRPQVPTYLDGKRLSYRLSTGEVKNMPGARWAEPLAEGVARAMSLYFAGSELGRVEGYYPWPNTSVDASRLSLNFQRFGATDSGQVHVVARWSLKRPDGQTVSGQYVSDSLSWSVGEAESLISAYNEALRALARAIEAQLAGMALR
jgi:uncharacterized lipoprotein YmbA